MSDLLRLFVQISLLKRGPQDLPASPTLLAMTALAYFVVNYLVYSMLPAITQPWRQHLISDVLYTLLSLALILKVAGKPERYLQTATAIFGYLVVLSPLTLFAGWLLDRYQAEPSVQFPVALFGLLLFVWMIAVGQQVLKAALELSTLASVVLVILWIFTGQLLIFYLFPGSPVAAGAVPVPPA